MHPYSKYRYVPLITVFQLFDSPYVLSNIIFLSSMFLTDERQIGQLSRKPLTDIEKGLQSN